jgi:AhpD family alkylhydroperoxidase
MSNIEEPITLCTPAVEELIGTSAAIAANCMPCLRYHVRTAESLGVSKADLARAVAIGSAVKQVPAKEVLELADRLLEGRVELAARTQTCCTPDKASSCGKGSCA